MFDFVHKHKRLIQLVLALLIIPPFAFWGIQSYESSRGSTGEVAEVNGQKITQQDFESQLRSQQERLRTMLGGRLDPSAFDTPESRTQMMESMVSQRLLTSDVVSKRLVTTDDNLRETIAGIPAFQIDGKFSKERYQDALRSEGFTPQAFEMSMRRDLAVQQLAAALGEANIVSRTVAKQWATLAGEQREVAQSRLQATSLMGLIKMTPEAIRAFYDENKKLFEVPEQARVEYVMLNADALMAADPITPEEIKAQYEARRPQYEQKEQRQASHILLTVKPDASGPEKAKVKARAEQLAEQVKKNPASFAEVAKKESEDPGSAARGGDLGFFSRGMMVPAFEDAVFAMKPGDVSGAVQSDFGFHVIRLVGVKPGKVKPLEEVRGDIERDLRKERAGKKFAEAAEQFSNTVYEQADTLQPVAEKFKLKVQDAGWVDRSQARPPLNNPRVLSAVFSPEALKSHRNTEAIEVAPGTLLAARVAEYRPATVKPFDEVRNEAARQLSIKEATALAWKEGPEKLELLRKGDTTPVPFTPAQVMGRGSVPGVAPEVVTAAFRAPVDKLPSYVGVQTADGYTLLRISKVIPAVVDEAKEKGMQAELGRMSGTSQMQAYIAALRADAKVHINQAALQKKE